MILTAEMFGDKWPFKFGCIEIIKNSMAFIIKTPATYQYALNGIAENQGYKKLDCTIWKNNPETGYKMSLSPILDYVQGKAAKND